MKGFLSLAGLLFLAWFHLTLADHHPLYYLIATISLIPTTIFIKAIIEEIYANQHEQI